MHLYYSFTLNFESNCVGLLGAFEADALALVEATLKYQPVIFGVLTQDRYPVRRQCMVVV